MLEIKYCPLKGFESLLFPSVTTDSSEYYPLSPLSVILGYSTPYSLIQSIPKDEIIGVEELYYMATVDDYLPPTLQQFKKELFKFKPLQFTTLKGLENILSRNTFTLPRIKEAIAECVGIKPIHTPRPESEFYMYLQTLLQEEGIEIQRHVYLAGYLVDIEIPSLNIVVEYDENNHKYYDNEKEKTREMAIKQLGYSIIRTDDSLSPLRSAVIVFNSIKNRVE